MTTADYVLHLSRWFDRTRCPIRPHLVQAWAGRAALHPSIAELALIGGFGSGKTVAGVNILVQIMRVNMMRQATERRAIIPRYAVISSSIPQLVGVTLPSFWGAYCGMVGWPGPVRKCPAITAWDGQRREAETTLGTVCWGSGHDGAQWIEGQEFVALLIDEAPLHLPEAMRRYRERLRQVGRRLVRCLIDVFTPQPGRSLAWLIEHYHGLTPAVPRDGVVMAPMPTRLNAAHLPPGYMERLRSMYSASMARALLEGEFCLVTGRSVPDWGEANVVEYRVDMSRSVEVWWDPGYHRPAMVAVQEVQPGSDIWCIFDQVAAADISTEQQGVELARRPWASMIRRVVHDPAAAGVASSAPGGMSDQAVLAAVLEQAFGVRPIFASGKHAADRSVELGMERLRAMVCDASGRRRLVIARSVVSAEEQRHDSNGKPIVGVWRAMVEQPLDSRTGVPDRRGDWDYWSHMVDVCRYGAVHHSLLQRIDLTAWREQVRDVTSPERRRREDLARLPDRWDRLPDLGGAY